jgi:carbamoyltransferase
MNVASSLQAITEDIILKIVKHTKKITGSKNLCMAGGVALNSVANGRIILEKIFDNCFFQPAATDAGGALGSALFAFNSIFNNERKYVMEHAFLGPEFDSKYIKNFLDLNKIEYERLSKEEIIKLTAEKIAKNKIIGWFQGRMEFGPRALGHRSILANPSNPKMKDILNEKVKKREWFRPFAPSLDIDSVERYFNISQDFPFMIVTLPVKRSRVKEIISATHVDKTARPQTTKEKRENGYHKLIEEFHSLTGIPAIINTSFNVRGEPIVCTPEDAFNCFKKTDIDYLVLENYLISKED